MLSLGCRGITLPEEIRSTDENGAAHAAPFFSTFFAKNDPIGCLHISHRIGMRRPVDNPTVANDEILHE